MTRATFASIVCLSGITTYCVGENLCETQNQELFLKVYGIFTLSLGLYEMTKNTVLSVASNFKSLESRIK